LDKIEKGKSFGYHRTEIGENSIQPSGNSSEFVHNDISPGQFLSYKHGKATPQSLGNLYLIHQLYQHGIIFQFGS